jgi:hypothetical protein
MCFSVTGVCEMRNAHTPIQSKVEDDGKDVLLFNSFSSNFFLHLKTFSFFLFPFSFFLFPFSFFLFPFSFFLFPFSFFLSFNFTFVSFVFLSVRLPIYCVFLCLILNPHFLPRFHFLSLPLSSCVSIYLSY